MNSFSGMNTAQKTTVQQRIRRMSFGGLLLAFLWVFLTVYDTGPVRSIPSRNSLRFALIGVTALVVFVSGKSNSIGQAFAGWAGLAAVAGILSSVFATAPPLGFIKLGLYAAIFIPLTFRSTAAELLFGHRRGTEFLSIAALTVLALGVVSGVGGSAAAELGNTNYVSAISLCVMPIFMLRNSHPGRIIRSKFVSPLLFVSLAVCVLNHSRGALLAAVVSVMTWWIFRKKPSKSTFVFAGCFLAAVLATLFLANQTMQDFAYKGKGNFFDENRVNEFSTSLEAVKERPILGYGFGLSWRVRPDHVDKVLKHGRMSWYIGEFGNSTLAIINGGGIILLVCFIGMMTVVFTQALATLATEYRVNGATKEYRSLVAVLAGVIGLLAHSQAEGWIMSPATGATFSFWMYCGATRYMTSRLRKQHRARQKQGSPSRPSLQSTAQK